MRNKKMYGFENQKLNMLYCIQTNNPDEALEYARETYNTISKPEVFGSGKKLISKPNYDPFMEYKHFVVGLALRDKYSIEMGPNRFTELEIRMEEVKPNVSIVSLLNGR